MMDEELSGMDCEGSSVFITLVHTHTHTHTHRYTHTRDNHSQSERRTLKNLEQMGRGQCFFEVHVPSPDLRSADVGAFVSPVEYQAALISHNN